MNQRLTALALAGAVMATSLSVATPAEAQWRRYGGYYHRGGYRGYGAGAIVGGALLGLGVGTLLAAPYYARPPVYYAPPPAYYPPPYAYAPYPYPPY